MKAIFSIVFKSIRLPVIFLAIGMGAGGWTVYKLYHLGEVRALKRVIVEQAEQHSDELALIAGHHENVLAIERDRVKIKEITKYVKDNRACDIAPDAVRLLDHARQGVPAASSRTAKAGGPVAGSVGIPQRVEVEAHADCGIKYRQLSEQLTALIKWHRLTN